ncbi:MAG: NAD-dependent epimerase/dehydratase family protein [Candidatus Anstonellaceae archaeon]
MSLVLVTGATGRIGSHLVKALLAKGDKVKAVVRPGSSHPLPPGAEKFEFDLAAGTLPESAFSGVEKIVHLAGLVGDHPYEELLKQNAFAVKNLLCYVPSSVQRIVIISSISVYGEYKGQIVDEKFELKSESAYGKSKLLGETFAREYCSTLPLVFLRPGMVYGSGFEEGYFPVLDYVKRGKMKIIGDGKNRVPLVHVLDLVQSILLALEADVPFCSTYNIVGSETLTQEELLALAAQELGVAPPSEHIPIEMAKFMASARSFLASIGLGKAPKVSADNLRQLTLDRAYSTAKARQELGFEARIKLREGLKEVVKDFLSKKGQV